MGEYLARFFSKEPEPLTLPFPPLRHKLPNKGQGSCWPQPKGLIGFKDSNVAAITS